jgi:hypothetical protein
MSFSQIKIIILCTILGAMISSVSYLLSTASYVGSSTDLILTPSTTNAGTRWTAENDQMKVEVRYITSVLEKPVINIQKKQQWLPLSICLSAGFLSAYFTYRIAMRKSRIAEAPIVETPVVS